MSERIIVDEVTYLGKLKNSIHRTDICMDSKGNLYSVSQTGSAIKGDQGCILYWSHSSGGEHIFKRKQDITEVLCKEFKTKTFISQ